MPSIPGQQHSATGDDDAGNAYQYTVITAQRGPHRGARVVAGFENDHQPEATVAA